MMQLTTLQKLSALILKMAKLVLFRRKLFITSENWEKIYNSFDRALVLLSRKSFVVGQVAWLTAVGGDCTTKESTDTKAKPDRYVDGNCRWQKGSWDLAFRAQISWRTYLSILK